MLTIQHINQFINSRFKVIINNNVLIHAFFIYFLSCIFKTIFNSLRTIRSS